eukprot:TRINITY_DN80226_c0_g1_i1.p1 TRINITY_DN80226_c0_g1~~TRINITY_DN80226_c0_g1_i1.p1  ORF type:complete len:596 (+),score=111.83 TRINITY_DN80226_c0_g1_i1:244-2031(+)
MVNLKPPPLARCQKRISTKESALYEEVNPSPSLALQGQKWAKLLLKFKFFQELESGVQSQLARICEHETVEAGTVLFRQGDPPGSCYVILQGQVEVWVKSEEELRHGDSRLGTPRCEPTRERRVSLSDGCRLSYVEGLEEQGEKLSEPRKQASGIGGALADVSEPLSPKSPKSPLSPKMRASRQNSGLPGGIGDGAVGSGEAPASGNVRGKMRGSVFRGSVMDRRPSISLLTNFGSFPTVRRRTMEAFSKYHDHSFLGVQVAVKGSGDIFGELALLQEQPRSATIKCREECEFLIISRASFDQVLKAEMNRKKLEKQEFLKAHVPGLRRLPPPRAGRADATYFFRKGNYPRGYCFLTQASKTDDILAIVHQGTVEILWNEVGELGGGSRPITPSSRPRTPLSRPGSAVSRCESLSPKKRSSADLPSGLDVMSSSASSARRIGLVMPGGVIGSMPTGDAEPFTLRVSSATCEVFFVNRQEMSKLPRALLDEVYEYLIRTQTWRLNCFREQRLKESESRKLSKTACKEAASGRADTAAKTNDTFDKASRLGLRLHTAPPSRSRSSPSLLRNRGPRPLSKACNAGLRGAGQQAQCLYI